MIKELIRKLDRRAIYDCPECKGVGTEICREGVAPKIKGTLSKTGCQDCGNPNQEQIECDYCFGRGLVSYSKYHV